MPSAIERQRGVLDAPREFGDMPFHYIGIGTAGSKLAHLAKCMHFPNVHAYDGDVVDEHNPYSQTYPRKAVGQPKVYALGREIYRDIGARIHVHNRFINEPHDFSGVVFLCVDGIGTQRRIWDTCLKGNGAIELMINVRMDASYVTIYTIVPANTTHQIMWEHHCHRPEESENDIAACGSPLSCPATSLWLAAEAQWQLIRWQARRRGENVPLPNMIARNMWTGEERKATWD